MSTQTPQQETLGQSVERAIQQSRDRAAQRLADAGAVYRGRQDPDHDATPTGVCLGCLDADADDASIPTRVSRVIGDNDGNVPACPRCVEGTERYDRAVQTKRGGRL